MKYNVLWSGGFDSTYMIQLLLSQDSDNQVRAYYLDIKNNVEKSKMEQEAIAVLKEKFKTMYRDRFEYKGIVLETNIKKQANCVYSPQLFSLLHGLFESVDYEWTDAVALGFVMNDNGISYIEDLKRIWKDVKNITYANKWPVLEFPLMKSPKSSIYDWLNADLRKDCVCCESFGTFLRDEKDTQRFCDKCSPCKRNREAGLISDRQKSTGIEITSDKFSEPLTKANALINDVEIDKILDDLEKSLEPTYFEI